MTAGNASTLNDGAACLVLASEAKAAQLGAEPLARVVASGVAGVDPAYMGIGPIPAIRRALDAAGLELGQIDLIEINEAFARASARLLTRAGNRRGEAERQRRRDRDRPSARLLGGPPADPRSPGSCGAARARYGVAALCVGVGQGLATVIENPTLDSLGSMAVQELASVDGVIAPTPRRDDDPVAGRRPLPRRWGLRGHPPLSRSPVRAS